MSDNVTVEKIKKVADKKGKWTGIIEVEQESDGCMDYLKATVRPVKTQLGLVYILTNTDNDDLVELDYYVYKKETKNLHLKFMS